MSKVQIEICKLSWNWNINFKLKYVKLNLKIQIKMCEFQIDMCEV